MIKTEELQIIEQLPLAIAFLDVDKQLVTASEFWFDHFKLNRIEDTGKSIYELFDNVDNKWEYILNNCLKGKPTLNLINRSNSKKKWFQYNNSPWYDEYGAIKGIILQIQDVTALKKNELVHSRSKKFLNNVLEVSNIGSWELDLAKNKLSWDSTTKRIHEIQEKYIPSLDDAIGFFKKGDNRKKMEHHFNEAINNFVEWDDNLLIKTASGKEILINTKGKVITEKGKPVSIIGTIKDINNREELSVKAQQFRSTFENNPNGIALFSLDGTFFRTNSSFCEMLGYTQEELYSLKPNILTHDDDTEKDKELLNSIISGELDDYEISKRYITKKGSTIFVTVKVSAICDHNGIILHFLKQVSDITDTLAIKRALIREKELLKTLINNLPVNIYIKNIRHRRTLANKAEYTYMGSDSEADLLGKTDYEMYPKDLAKRNIKEDENIFFSGIPILNKEQTSTNHLGEKTHFLSSKIPLKDEQEHVTGLLGIAINITDLKKTENKQKQLIKVTAEQNKRLLNFAHIVSHNLRSHSANFSMLINLLQTENDGEIITKIFTMLKNASDNLMETIGHLNDVVAINATVEQEKKELNINTYIKRSIISIEALINKSNCTIINNVKKNTYLKSVPSYFESILLNFLTNAIKYKHPKRDPVITINCKKKKLYTELSIEDNGLGIDLAKHGKKIFGMYNVFHDHPEAKGIGLFITKSQMQAMKGKIEVESKVNEGTKFKIYFNEKN